MLFLFRLFFPLFNIHILIIISQVLLVFLLILINIIIFIGVYLLLQIIGHLLQVDLFAFGGQKFINVDDPPAHLDFSIGRYGVDHPVDGHLLNHLLLLLFLFVFYRFLVFLLFLFFFFLWRLSLIWWNKEVILALFTVAVLNGDVLLQFQKLKQLVVVVGRLKIFKVL